VIDTLSSIDTAFLLGLCFSGVALSLVVSLRFLNFPDLTIEGSFPLGGAVAGIVLVRTGSAALAITSGVIAGALSGLVTAGLHVFLRIGKLLSGILVLAITYSVTLRVLGGSNLSLLTVGGLWSRLERYDQIWTGGSATPFDPARIAFLLVLSCILSSVLIVFFRATPGIAIRAAGDNENLLPTLGRDPRPYKFVALAISNGLAALAGSLVSFNQGFADVGMGHGVLILGLAALMLGEQTLGRLLGPRRLVAALVLAAVAGSVLYQGILLVSFRLGVSASDVKALTAMTVLGVIVLSGGGSVFYRGRTF
jgi:putative ABC transport system permease protein